MSGKDLEKKIQQWHFRLELIRTIVPVLILAIQPFIIYKLFFSS